MGGKGSLPPYCPKCHTRMITKHWVLNRTAVYARERGEGWTYDSTSTVGGTVEWEEVESYCVYTESHE